jgi:hypothetical protein
MSETSAISLVLMENLESMSIIPGRPFGPEWTQFRAGRTQTFKPRTGAVMEWQFPVGYRQQGRDIRVQILGSLSEMLVKFYLSQSKHASFVPWLHQFGTHR